MRSSASNKISSVFMVLAVRQLFIADGMRVDFGVFAKNAVDLRRLEKDVGLQFAGPQGGGGVGGDIRVAGSSSENNDAPFFQMADCPAANERLGDRLHV